MYDVDEAQDEFGNDRFFVCDPDGNWIGDAYDTRELAQAEADHLNLMVAGL